MKPFTYHTHTTYCDGKNTPEEMAKAAFDFGVDSLGIGYHSYVDFDADYCVDPAKIQELKSEAYRLQKLYNSKGMDIFFGVEQDAISPSLPNDHGHDYVIGSMHYLTVDDETIIIDGKRNYFKALSDHFNNDALALALEYYKNVIYLHEKTRCDIVGHFDLVTKYNEGYCLFDERDGKYENAALAAIEKLTEKNVIFEINTGAMARGYRSTPYPSKRLLSMIRECNGRITYSSDCHNASLLTHGFEYAQKFAYECGFKHFMKLKRTPSGCEFLPEEIEVTK